MEDNWFCPMCGNRYFYRQTSIDLSPVDVYVKVEPSMWERTTRQAANCNEKKDKKLGRQRDEITRLHQEVEYLTGKLLKSEERVKVLAMLNNQLRTLYKIRDDK